LGKDINNHRKNSADKIIPVTIRIPPGTYKVVPGASFFPVFATKKIYRNDAFGTGMEGTKRKSKPCVKNRARKAQGKS